VMAVVVASCAGPVDTAPAGVEPLDQVFGNLDPARQAEAMDQARERENLMRGCMAAEGFEYVPYVGTEDTRVGAEVMVRRMRSAVKTADDEFVRSFGYGSTEMQIRLAAYFANDPNRVIQDRLGPEEYRVYMETLTACSVTAREAYGMGDEVAAAWSTFEEELADLDRRIVAAPEVVDATREWSRCMAREGYRFSSLEDPVREVEERFAGTFEEAYAAGETVGPGNGPPQLAPDVVAGLQAAEVALAVADAGCRVSTGLAEVLERVRAEMEARWVAEHGDLLEMIGG